MSEEPAAAAAAETRSRVAGDGRAVPPAAAPPPAGIDGLPSIATIINDPKARDAVLARLRKRERAPRPPLIRIGAALAGMVALFAALFVASRYYSSWRAGESTVAGPVVIDAPAPPPGSDTPSTAPRPVATAPVRVEGPPVEPRPLLSEEWLRAHEALGLPPPKLVRTVKIVPPRAE